MPSTMQFAQQLDEAMDEEQRSRISIWAKHEGQYLQLQIAKHRGADTSGQWRNNRAYIHVRMHSLPGTRINDFCCPNDCPKDLLSAFSKLRALVGDAEPLLDSLIVNCWSDALIPLEGDSTTDEELPFELPDSPIYQKARLAWCEMFGIEAPLSVSQPFIDGQAFREKLIREPLLALLNNEDRVQWNDKTILERTFSRFEETDLRGKKLSQINFSYVKLNRSVFDQADLSYSNLANSDLSSASMKGAQLEKSVLSNVIAIGADFSGANLKNAELKESNLQHARFTEADLSKAKLNKADLRNVDLTDCASLNGAKFKGALYDETTTLSSKFEFLKDLKWVGIGPDPYKLLLKKAIYASGPVDFAGLIAILEETFDKERLKKALSMLKKETFQLFSDVKEDSVYGIVKSQTDKELVYGCRLVADGSFSCCTQNLNTCGGLRGSLCKHLLVLVIGLSRAQELNPTTTAHWVRASVGEKPVLNRELITELFIKYGATEHGDIDWRPTETIPEDYYAF